MTSIKLERMERESKDGRTGKKRRIEIDFEKLLSTNGSTDEFNDLSEKGVERPEGENGEHEQEHSPCLNLAEERVRLQDRELNEKIRTLAKRIKICSFKALLKQHQEKERRRERCRSSKVVLASAHCDDWSEKEVERPEGENGEHEQEHSPCLNLAEERVRLQDRELNEKIRTLAKRIKTYSPTLPDKGVKFKALLKQHQEKERRRERSRSSKDVTGCSKPALSGSSRQSGATHASLPLKGKDKIDLSSEEVFTDKKNLADTNFINQSSPRDIRRSLRQKDLKSEKFGIPNDPSAQATPVDHQGKSQKQRVCGVGELVSESFSDSFHSTATSSRTTGYDRDMYEALKSDLERELLQKMKNYREQIRKEVRQEEMQAMIREQIFRMFPFQGPYGASGASFSQPGGRDQYKGSNGGLGDLSGAGY